MLIDYLIGTSKCISKNIDIKIKDYVKFQMDNPYMLTIVFTIVLTNPHYLCTGIYIYEHSLRTCIEENYQTCLYDESLCHSTLHEYDL